MERKKWKTAGRRALALFLAFVMLMALGPVFDITGLFPRAVAASYNLTASNIKSGATYSLTDGNTYTVADGTYDIKGFRFEATGKTTLVIPAGAKVTIDNRGTTYGSPVAIGHGATLNLVVDGTLNVYGQEAGFGVDVTLDLGNFNQGVGGEGGHAGIRVNSGSTLVVRGAGEVNAYGGDAAEGGFTHTDSDLQGGAGGGGGAGAGIGADGGNGAAGQRTDSAYGSTNTTGGTGGNAGEINLQGKVKVKAYGGGGASGQNFVINGSGGAGGGYPAAGVGGGGAGGGGAGGCTGGAGFSGTAGEQYPTFRGVNGLGGKKGSHASGFGGSGYFEVDDVGNYGIGGSGGTSGGYGGAGGTVKVSALATLSAYNGSYITGAYDPNTGPYGTHTDFPSGSKENPWGENQTPIYAQLGYSVPGLRVEKVHTVQGRGTTLTFLDANGSVMGIAPSAALKSEYGLGVGAGAGNAEYGNGTYAVMDIPTVSALEVKSFTANAITLEPTVTPGGSAVTGYRVEYKLSTASNWTTKTFKAGEAITFTGLTAGATYDFRLHAENEWGESATSAQVSQRAYGVPDGVTVSSTSRGVGQVSISWGAPNGNGDTVTHYTVQYKTGSSGTWVSAVEQAGQTYTVNGVPSGETVYFQVKAKNAAGYGPWGAEAQVKSFAAPGKPALRVVGGTREVSLSWDAVEGDSQTVTYYVYRAHGGTTTEVYRGTGTSAKDSNLSNGTTYSYYLTASSAAGDTKSDTVSAATHGVPGQPQGVTAVNKSWTGTGNTLKNTVTVSWGAPSSDGGTSVTNYIVSWYRDGTKVGETTVGNVLTMDVGNLESGKQYQFYVAAVNAAGAGTAATNNVTAYVTTWSVPSVINTVSGDSSGGNLTVTWNAPNWNLSQEQQKNLTYNVYIYSSKAAADEFTTADKMETVNHNSASPKQTLTVSGLSTEVETYYVRVVAINPLGASVPSDSYGVGLKAAPGQASNIQLGPVLSGGTPTHSESSLQVTWGAAAANGSSVFKYVVQLQNMQGQKVDEATIEVTAENTPLRAEFRNLNMYTQYKAVVTAYNHSGAEGAEAAGQSAASDAYRTARNPFEPRNVRAVSNNVSRQLKVTWEAPGTDSGSQVTGYYVYLYQEGDTALNDPVNTDPITVLEYTVGGLEDGKSYHVAVLAENAIGRTLVENFDNQQSELLKRVNDNNSDVGTPRRAADAPRAVKAQIKSGSQVDLTWTAPENLGGSPLKGYEVEVLSSANTGALGEITVDKDGNGKATVTGLEEGGVYAFRIHAVTERADALTADLAGADSTSNQVTLWRKAQAPGGLTAAPTDETTRVKLTWTYPGDDGDTLNANETLAENHTFVSQYAVYYREKSGQEWTRVDGLDQALTQRPAAGTTHEKVLSGLEDGTGYEFKVAGVNGVGQGLKSAVVSATPRRVPEAPSTLDGAVLVDNAGLKHPVLQGSYLDGDETKAFYEGQAGTVSGDRSAKLTLIVPPQDTVADGKTILGDGGDEITAYKIYAQAARCTLENGYVTDAQPLAQDQFDDDGDGNREEPAPVLLKKTLDVSGLEGEALALALENIMVPDLENGRDYILTVKAVNGAGESTFSSGTGVRVGLPTTPQNLGAQLATTTSSNLSMLLGYDAAQGNGSDVTGYELEVLSGEPDVTYGENGVIAATGVTHLFTGTIIGEELTICVRALNQYGAGTWSQPITVVVGSPSRPENVDATLYEDRVDLTWSAASNNGSRLERYIVYLQTEGGEIVPIKVLSRLDAGFKTAGEMTVQVAKDGTNNAQTVDGVALQNYGTLSPGTEYTFYVAAQNVAGVGPLSQGCRVKFGVPQAPEIVQDGVTFEDQKLTVRWTAPADDGGDAITHYKVYANGDLKATLPEETLRPLDGVYTYELTGLANGVDYAVQVSAVNGRGEGGLSAAKSATPARMPEPPRSLAAEAVSDTQVRLTWMTPSYDGGDSITGYVVRAYTVDGNGNTTLLPDVAVEEPQKSGANWSAVVSGLGRGQNYRFRVFACNKANASKETGNEAESNAVTTWNVPGKATITGLESIVPDTDTTANWSVRVKWDPPADDGGTEILGYYVYSGSTLKSGMTGGERTLLTSTEFVITGMNYNQTYDRINIVAVNAVGETRSDFASVRVGRLAAPTVTSIITDVTGIPEGRESEINVTWSPVSGVVDGFRIYAIPEQYAENPEEAERYIATAMPNVVTKELSGTITSRDVGEEVYLCVVAYNGEIGNSPIGKIYHVTVGSTGKPTGLTALPGKEQVKLSWAEPEEKNGGEITGYEIYLDGTLKKTLEGTATETTVEGLTGGGNCTFTVRALSQNSVVSGQPVVRGIRSQESDPALATPWSDPTAPVLVSAESADGKFTLTFRTSDGKGLSLGADSYDIYLRPVDQEGPAVLWSADNLVYQDNGATVSVEVSQVENGTEYYAYAVAKTTADGETYNYSVAPDLSGGDVGDESMVLTVTPGVLGAPAIRGITAGSTSASIRWTAPQDPSNSIGSYIVIYSTGESGAPVEKTVENPQTTEYVIEGLTPGYQYRVTVRAVNSNGPGRESEPVTVRVGTPTAPVIGKPESGDRTAAIHWSPSSETNGGPVQMYKVYLMDADGSEVFYYADGNSQSLNLDNLTNGMRYQASVSAVNKNGEGARSESVAVTPGTEPDAVAPGTVEISAVSDRAVRVSWRAPENTGGLPILRYLVSGPALAEPLETESTSILIDNLEKGKSYSFTIRAVNAVGMSAETQTPTATTLTEPGKPSWRSLTSANGTFTAKWLAPAVDGGSAVSEYILSLYTSVDAGAETFKSFPVIPSEANSETSGGQVSYLYTGEPGSLEIGTEYYVSVKAVNGIGEGAESDRLAIIITGQVANSEPGKPYGLTATAANSSITVSWTKPLYDGNLTIDGYRVSYYETENPDATLRTQWVGGANSTSYTVTGLKNGVEYTVYVQANNTVGDSVPSDSVKATPYFIAAPGPVQNLRYKNNNTNNIMTIYWDAPATGGESEELTYNVYLNNELRASESTATSMTVQIPAANIGSLYYIKVEAVNSGGVSDPVNIRARSTLNVMSNNVGDPNTNLDTDCDGELDEVASAKTPGAPTLLEESTKVLSGSKKIHLEWTAPANDGGAAIEGYYIYINSSKGNTVYDFSEFAGDSLADLKKDFDMEAGVVYNVRISAYNEAGEGSYSTTLQMYLAPSNAPQNLRAEKQNKTGTIMLAWDAPNSGEQPTEYKVQVNGEDIPTGTLTGNTFPYGGEVDKNYIFRVYAKYGDETSKTTDPVRVSTVLATPAAPTGLTASAETVDVDGVQTPTGKVTLTWQASENDDPALDIYSQVDDYQVYANGEPAATISAAGAAEYTCEYAGATETDYTFYVVARNSTKESARSGSASATTKVPQTGAPGLITDLTAQAEGAALGDKTAALVPITLQWTVPTAAEGAALSYQVFYSIDGGVTFSDIVLGPEDIQVDADGVCTFLWQETEAPARGNYVFKVVPTAQVEGSASAEGLASNLANVSTFRQVPPPPVPTVAEVAFAGDSAGENAPNGTITVSWTVPEGAEVDYYTLYVDGVAQTQQITGATVQIDATPGKFSYAIQVSATNGTDATAAAGKVESALSEAYSFTIDRESDTPLTPPAAADAVQFAGAVSNGENQIRVSWSLSADAQVYGYRLIVDGAPLVDEHNQEILLGHDVNHYDFIASYYTKGETGAVPGSILSGTHVVQVEAVKYFSPTLGTVAPGGEISADAAVVPGTLSNAQGYQWKMVLGLNVASNAETELDPDKWVADTNLDADGDGTRDTIGTVVRLTGTVDAGGAASLTPEIVLKDAFDNQIQGEYYPATKTFVVEVNLGAATASEAAALAEGSYTLTVTKPGCTSYTITDIDLSAVGEDGIDLGTVTLSVGDVNGDGVIDGSDVAMIRGSIGGQEQVCDLNDDGWIDGSDVAMAKGNIGNRNIALPYRK